MKKAFRTKKSDAKNEAATNANFWTPWLKENRVRKPLKKFNWTISESERRASDPQIPPSELRADDHYRTVDSNTHVASWILRWCKPDIWDAFSESPPLNTAAVKWRVAHLRKKGFRKIPNPSDALRESIILENPHNGILRERHTLNIHGKHERSLEILDGNSLALLTSDIKKNTDKVLNGNKFLDKVYSKHFFGHVSNAAKGISWSVGQDEYELRMKLKPKKLTRIQKKWLEQGLAARRELAALMKEHWDMIRALRVYDPLSPKTLTVSLEPLLGATIGKQKNYLNFLIAVARANEIVQRKGRRFTFTGKQNKRVEPLIRAGISDRKIAEKLWPNAEEIDYLEGRVKRFRISRGFRRR